MRKGEGGGQIHPGLIQENEAREAPARQSRRGISDAIACRWRTSLGICGTLMLEDVSIREDDVQYVLIKIRRASDRL